MLARASGQAQEQRVNLENSIKLQRNMMKMVFGELAYQRQLFPEDCFELKEMGGNHIHTLSAESDNVYHEQVSRMISWYSDDSVLDALRNGYLEKVMFVLAHDQACEHPIEVWDLSYTYESDDTVSSRFSRRSGGGGAPASESIEVARSPPKDKVTKDYIRDVVKVVLRRLSLLLQGLDDVPQERWCGMRLLYRDDVTPSNYEPSGFSPAPATVAGAGSFFFERPATFFKVGKVSTGHHALSLGVALPEMPGIEPTAHDEACTTRDGSGYRFDLVQAADGPPDDEDELRGGVGLRGGRRGNGEDLERLTQEASEGLEDHIGAHITAHDLAAELEVEAIVAEEVLQRLQADGRVSCLKPNPQGPPTRQVQRFPSGATSQDELTSAHEWTEADDGPSDAETVAHWNSSPPPRDRRAASGEASPRKKLRVPLKKQPIAHQKQPLGDRLQATRSSKRQRKASMSEPIAPARL